MRRIKRAFTLVELLVVISIIALLLAMLMPALSKVREEGRRTVCKNNLHQVGLSWTLYAQDNKERYPQMYAVNPRNGTVFMPAFGNWQIVTEPIHDIFIAGRYGAGGKKGEAFYCPNWKVNAKEMWNTPGYRDQLSGVKGYYISYPMYAGTYYGKLWNEWLNNRLPPPEKTTDSQASKSPIMMDETCWYGAAYGNAGYGSSRHMRNATEPAGGSALFGDAHVEWRKFKTMTVLMNPVDFKRFF